jgi:fimbrial chaperone protein
VTLPADGGAKVMRVRNLSAEPTLVQLEAVSWVDVDQPLGGEPAREILAVPPVFELGGDAEQVIRLAVRQPLQGELEKAFRLFVTEVPREAIAEPGAVAFAMRLNLPVFVTPEGAKADPVWSLRRGSGGAAELLLANNGGAHVRIQSLSVGDGDAEPLLTIEQAAYVLAGGEKSWPISLPAGTVKELSVRAETNLGELEAQVALPGG